MAHELKGNWRYGLAYDLHTLSSVYLGIDQYGRERYDSTRSEMGELVYQLKYQRQTGNAAKIAMLLDRIKGIEEMDRIVPIPPTDASRPFQPVRLIAEALGARRGVEVLPDLLVKQPGGLALKDVELPSERQKLLRETMSLSPTHSVAGLRLLLLDDLYRSGATLAAATDLLLTEGRADDVVVLTMTKTRSNR